MKKYLLVVFCAVLLFVTGCGNKNQLKCSATQTESGMTMKAEVIADFDDNDKLTDATAVYDLGDKEAATQYCSFFKLMEDAAKGVKIDCSGTKITINGFAKMEEDDEDPESVLVGKTKEDFKKAMEEEKFTCK